MITDDLLEISKELTQKERGFIIFTGAGVIDGTGIPNWGKLLARLLESSQDERKINQIDEEDYPEVAQQIYDKLKAEGKLYLYDNIIQDAITPTSEPCTIKQVEIVKTTNWVVTTNFDNTFESAFAYKPQCAQPNIRSLPSFIEEDLSEKESVIYLHGSVDKNYIIFRKEEYDTYYPSVSGKVGVRSLENYLAYIFKNQTLVFIGFSFNDKYVRKALQNIFLDIQRTDEDASRKLGYEPKAQKIKHYVFMKKLQLDFPHNIEDFNKLDPESNEYREFAEMTKKKERRSRLYQELTDLNCHIVEINEYIDWIHCLQEVQKLRKAGKVIDE